jgi:predicted nucleic acid-binding protein
METQPKQCPFDCMPATASTVSRPSPSSFFLHRFAVLPPSFASPRLCVKNYPASWHEPARAFLESLTENPDVVIAELVLVEFYLALLNPAIMAAPLSAAEAVAECQWFRAHPRWALAEHTDVRANLWPDAAGPAFARRRIIDVRLARTLLAHGVKEFATANLRDFQDLGFSKVWNPLTPA